MIYIRAGGVQLGNLSLLLPTISKNILTQTLELPMRHLAILLTLLVGYTTATYAQTPPIALVIHGGAGTLTPDNITPEREKRYRAKLKEALQAGYAVLKKGGKSGDAIVAAIQILENSPLFNAGKGAVFNSEGKNELDASFMDGETLQAGAVAGITTIKNPVLAARAVLEHSPHVLLSGKGAETFAAQQGLEVVDPSYFHTKRQKKRLKQAQKEGSKSKAAKKKYGTVGAVALDKFGHIAAATSTGGLSNKRFGRIGDSPIIGAGTYADDNSCGVSCTGQGEYFIRGVIAYDVAARMQYKGSSVKNAAEHVIQKKLTAMGGLGGLIALDKKGNIAMSFNTPNMLRGWVTTEGEMRVAIFKKER